jgi:very-short-patch-repair endonuclease
MARQPEPDKPFPAPGPGGGRGTSRPDSDDEVPRYVQVLGARNAIAVTGSRDERISRIAEAQRGRVSTAQLYAAGISSGAISRRLASSRLIRVHRCVFAVGHMATTPLGEETAALLAVGSTAVLADVTGAGVVGLIEPVADGPVHVTLPQKRRIALTGVVIHRTALLGPRDVRIRHGLPVMSPARALLDLAASDTISERELELAFDRGIVERVFRPAEVAELLTRALGHPGRGRLAALLSRQAGESTMTRSEAEERVLALIRAARLPAPQVNARLEGYEVDFLWPEHRFVLEVDGFRFHTTRGAFERDRRKDADLRRAEIEVLRTSWRAIEREPYVLVADVARELTRAELRTRPESLPRDLCPQDPDHG